MITTDQETTFTSAKVRAFTAQYGIQLLHFSPYYLQANGKAKMTNKVLISIIKRALEDNPRGWHDTLEEALWTYRNVKSFIIGSIPYRLTYGHDDVLPLEIIVSSLQILEDEPAADGRAGPDFLQELDALPEERLQALERIQHKKNEG
ncbi:uncharacterized protein LOC127265874 [Andrographis paniculata]|uniref:uncharacterized protein LOC127265874 n=1 Tax=Andrographis paniculata TaxID=175694 RepID=UPI0021E90546|nr:uncharacterized protein LOC127265874 [Andrographis paniculata]